MRHKAKIIAFSLCFVPFFIALFPAGYASSLPDKTKKPVETAALSLNFSPYYIDGRDPEMGSPVSEAEMRAALAAIAPYCDTIRTFGVTGEMTKLYKIAREEFGLRVIAGCWIGSGYTDALVRQELQTMADLANNGLVDILLIGSEGLFRRDYTAAQLAGWADTLRDLLQTPLPVGTSDTAYQLLQNADALMTMDVIGFTYYPFFEKTHITHALANFSEMHGQLKAAFDGKPLFCSESGWPDAGGSHGDAEPGPENAARYFEAIYAYSREQNVEICYFEALSESWKGKYGLAEKSFGLMDSGLMPKPHFSEPLKNILRQRED